MAEDSATSPFGLKIAAVSSNLSRCHGHGPERLAGVILRRLFGATPPNSGDKISVQFSLPDGTTEQIDLTATTTKPVPVGSFAIDMGDPAAVPVVAPDPTVTATNFNNALNDAIKKLAGTSLTAASAVTAGDNFFNSVGSVTANVAAVSQAATPAPRQQVRLRCPAPIPRTRSPRLLARATPSQ